MRRDASCSIQVVTKVATLATFGTLVGAACVLVGAVLLMPEAVQEEDRDWVAAAGAAPA